MINLIIYSKNRPMQLQATIDSIEINTRGFFNSISVIYVADSDYQPGYDLLAKRRPFVNFIKQKDDLVKETLKVITQDYICLAADDDIFYRPIGKNWVEMMWDKDVFCFSLRLGLNINYCYPLKKENPIGEHKEKGEFIKWEWRKQEHDWAYPLSTISHIYRSEDFARLSSKITKPVKNLNEYEAYLQEFINEVPEYMASWKEGAVFGVPANRVNDTHKNDSGLTHSYTAESLNKMYLDGFIIDIPSMTFDINAAQQEIEYKFKKYGN